MDARAFIRRITMLIKKHSSHLDRAPRLGLALLLLSTPSALMLSQPALASEFTVASPTTILSNEISTGDLDGATDWQYERDPSTKGEARGSTLYPATTPLYDDAREFYMTYSNHGGERWFLSFGNDVNASHFVYDTYIYLVDPSQVQNLELDINQVTPNGETVIFATECASGSKTWEYTIVKDGKDEWVNSNVGCDPTTWAAKKWHHVQIAAHRDSKGVVTHDWVDVDSQHSDFRDAVGAASQKLGWPVGDLVINFQLDGNDSGKGEITSYVHDLTVYRW
jgi:hypothetical protein